MLYYCYYCQDQFPQYCLLDTALAQLSRPDKITQARFHLPKAPVLLLLGLTVRTPPQAGKDCVRDQGPTILVPGSSKYSTIKCLSSRSVSKAKAGRGRELLLLAERSWPLSWPLLQPGRFVAARYELLHAGCSVRAQLLWHSWLIFAGDCNDNNTVDMCTVLVLLPGQLVRVRGTMPRIWHLHVAAHAASSGEQYAQLSMGFRGALSPCQIRLVQTTAVIHQPPPTNGRPSLSPGVRFIGRRETCGDMHMRAHGRCLGYGARKVALSCN